MSAPDRKEQQQQFAYIACVQRVDARCRDLAATHGRHVVEPLQLTVHSASNVAAPDESGSTDVKDLILNAERKLDRLEEALRAIRRLEDGDTKTYEAPLSTDDVPRLRSLPHAITAAAFLDYMRIRPRVMEITKTSLMDCAHRTVAPLCIGLSVRERIPLAPLCDGKVAFKYWCSPQLLHAAHWLAGRRRFDNPFSSELLDYFADAAQYESKLGDTAQAEKVKATTAAKGYAVDRVWEHYAQHNLLFTQPHRVLANLTNLKATLETGSFIEAFGHRARASLKDGAGLPTTSQPLRERHFAMQELRERFADPLAVLIAMQRAALTDAPNPSVAEVRCLDGKMRGLAEYDAYAKSAKAASATAPSLPLPPTTSTTAEAPRPLSSETVKPTVSEVLRPPKQMEKAAAEEEENGEDEEEDALPLTLSASPSPPSPIRKMPSAKAVAKPSWASLVADGPSHAADERKMRAFERFPVTAAAAGKGSSSAAAATATATATAAAAGGDLSSTESTSTGARHAKRPMAPLMQLRNTTCPQAIDADELYRLCSHFFYGDVNSYQRSETAEAQLRRLQRRCAAIRADDDMNQVDQQPTDERPYKGARWPIARVSKAVYLLESLIRQMSFDFDELELLGDPKELVPGTYITTTSGRVYRKVHALNMSRWMYGFGKDGASRNCWIELAHTERQEIYKYVDSLLVKLREVEAGYLAVTQDEEAKTFTGLTKDEIDRIPALRGVNEFLALLPGRMDNTDPLVQAVMGSDDLQTAGIAAHIGPVAGQREAMLEVLATRATLDKLRAHMTQKERAHSDEETLRWIGDRKKRFSPAILDLAPFLWLQQPRAAWTPKIVAEGVSSQELVEEVGIMHRVPFKLTVDAFRKGLALNQALYVTCVYYMSRMVQTACQFAVDRLLGDVLLMEHTRIKSSGPIPRVPWQSSYRHKSTPSASRLFQHPTGVSTVEGVVHESVMDVRDSFERFHKNASHLLSRANSKIGVNINSLYSLIHNETRPTERSPGLINDFLSLLETAVELGHRHSGALRVATSSRKPLRPEEDDPIASHVLHSLLAVLTKVSAECNRLMRDVANKLADLTQTAAKEWQQHRRKNTSAEDVRVLVIPLLHDLLWRRVGAGRRNTHNVYSVANEALFLSKALHVKKMLCLATGSWMLHNLVYDNAFPSPQASAHLQLLVHKHASSSFE